MILADTSVWIEHFRNRNAALVARLDRDEILTHAFVLGELMLSGLHRRPEAMRELRRLPHAPLVDPEEVANLIESAELDGRGIGYVDAALLAAARLIPGTLLWTLDRKLHGVAASLAIASER